MAQNAIWSREFQTSIPRYQVTRVLTIWHVKPTQSTALEQERFDVRSLSPAFHNLWLLLVCLKSLIKDTNRKKIHYTLLFTGLNPLSSTRPSAVTHTSLTNQVNSQSLIPSTDEKQLTLKMTTAKVVETSVTVNNISGLHSHGRSFPLIMTSLLLKPFITEIDFKSSIFHCNAKMSFGFTEWWKTSIVSPVSSDHSLVGRWCARSMAHFYSQTLLICLSLIPVCHSLSIFRSSVSLSIFP